MSSRFSYRFPFAQYPAIRIVLFLIVGILSGKWLGIDLFIVGIFFGAGTLFLLFLEWRNRRLLNINVTRVVALFFLVLTFLFGWFRFQLHELHEEPIIVQLAEVSPWEEMEFSGIIEFINKNAEGNLRADVSIKETKVSSQNSSNEI